MSKAFDRVNRVAYTCLAVPAAILSLSLIAVMLGLDIAFLFVNLLVKSINRFMMFLMPDSMKVELLLKAVKRMEAQNGSQK